MMVIFKTLTPTNPHELQKQNDSHENDKICNSDLQVVNNEKIKI